MALWIPPDSEYRPRVERLPEGDVILDDGRKLRQHDRFNPTRWCEGWRYTGPGDLIVIASVNDTEKFGLLVHVSLSYPERDPPWKTIRLVKDAFFGPAVDTMMVLPRAVDYVNVHEHCFHLWETPSAWSMR